MATVEGYTYDELADIGAALVNVAATACILGHASPAGTLDYVKGVHDGAPGLVADFIAWTSGRKSLRPGCEDRMREAALRSPVFTRDVLDPRLFGHPSA